MVVKFDYKRPKTIEEATKILSENKGSKIIAGGTDLMVEIRSGKESNLKCVVDITQISELKGIEIRGDKIVIKALTSHCSIKNSKIILEYLNFLSKASGTVGSPQIRNTGTIGGSLGTASPSSDPVPVLVAGNGRVVLENSNGETRTMLIEDFILKPTKTALLQDEIILEVIMDNLKDYGTSFLKLGRRKALAIARINVAVAIKKNENGEILDIRIVPGSCLPVAKRILEAENILLGEIPSVELIEKTAEVVAREMIKETGIRWSTEFKEPVVATLVKRAIIEALEVK